MCSHYVGQKTRAKLARMGLQIPLEWEPPSGSFHICPTRLAPIIRRPPERDFGDEAVKELSELCACSPCAPVSRSVRPLPALAQSTQAQAAIC